MRLFIWLWDVFKGIFIKKPAQEPIVVLVELKPPPQDDPMECLENFIEVSLTV